MLVEGEEVGAGEEAVLTGHRPEELQGLFRFIAIFLTMGEIVEPVEGEGG